jgi:hypothetical protein
MVAPGEEVVNKVIVVIGGQAEVFLRNLETSQHVALRCPHEH